jgi:hypothetical protein
MRADEVPQETNPLFDNERKTVYAVNAAGDYVMVKTGGSEVDFGPTLDAGAWFAEQAEAARQRVLRGESSTLEYWMYQQRMDVLTLAQATGLWQWRIRRHLRPAIFNSLSPRLLQRHADAMGLSISELQQLPAATGTES